MESCDIFGQNIFYYIVCGKYNLGDKHMADWQLNLTTITEQTKPSQSKHFQIEKTSTILGKKKKYEWG